MTTPRSDPIRRILPLVVALVGLVWLLQGLGVPIGKGSFMIGDPTWAVIGAILIAAAALLSWKRR